jgi:2-polyprenyl-3-methyl-5-hydroxy-6-metoxy-1,4-benzoquinol methylase
MESAIQPSERASNPRRTRDDLRELWRASLVTDGYDDPRESALHELSLYFGMSREEARERCLRWEQDSIVEWEAHPRDTAEGLLDFYRTQRSWIFDTVWYHALQYTGERPAESILIAQRLEALEFTPSSGASTGRASTGVAPVGRHLDFGAGPGSTSLFFHRLGWEVALADISTTMRDFARWRLGRRGIEATYYDTSREDLPPDSFDVITACDVMAHVPDPRETLERLHRALRVGGYLIFNVDARPIPSRETQWHLYPYAYPVLRPVRAVGFARESQLEFFHVYRKLAANPILRICAGLALDACRYNGWVSRTARARGASAPEGGDGSRMRRDRGRYGVRGGAGCGAWTEVGHGAVRGVRGK